MPDRLCRWTISALICGNGCLALGSESQTPTTAPATAPVPFCCAKYGFAVQLPEDWSLASGAHAMDEPFLLVPRSDAGMSNPADSPSLKMTVPVLPMHIPGMIPVGSVANGYVDDLRKQYPDVKVDERVVVSIPSASARRVLLSYHCGQVAWRDIVLCIVHKDRVFLLQADCPADNYPATRAAFDDVANSLKWQ